MNEFIANIFDRSGLLLLSIYRIKQRAAQLRKLLLDGSDDDNDDEDEDTSDVDHDDFFTNPEHDDYEDELLAHGNNKITSSSSTTSIKLSLPTDNNDPSNMERTFTYMPDSDKNDENDINTTELVSIFIYYM